MVDVQSFEPLSRETDLQIGGSSAQKMVLEGHF